MKFNWCMNLGLNLLYPYGGLFTMSYRDTSLSNWLQASIEITGDKEGFGIRIEVGWFWILCSALAGLIGLSYYFRN